MGLKGSQPVYIVPVYLPPLMDVTVPVLLFLCVSVLLTKSSSPVVGLSTAYAVP